MEKSVSAIVPAYNEGLRIGEVLKVLVNTPILNEVIVVDDGSDDDTRKVVKQFKSVVYLRNKLNRGKAYSLEKGVRVSKGEVIFFCDADLRGLTPRMVDEIVRPVLEGKYDMYIGLRNNFTQRLWHYTALCSGERCLHKTLWNQLPRFYKKGYRIEAGLNEFVKKYGSGLGYKLFPYYQTGSEKKRGILNGLKFRLKMFYGIFSGMLVFKCSHIFGFNRSVFVKHAKK